MAGNKPGRKSNKQLAREAGLTIEEFMAKKARKAKREAEPGPGNVVPIGKRKKNKAAAPAKRGRKSADGLMSRDETFAALLEMPIEDLVDQFCIASAACSAPRDFAKAEMELLREAIRCKLTVDVTTEYGTARLRKENSSFIPQATYVDLVKKGIFGNADVELNVSERNAIGLAVKENRLSPDVLALIHTEESYKMVLEANENVKGYMADAMSASFKKVVQTHPGTKQWA